MDTKTVLPPGWVQKSAIVWLKEAPPASFVVVKTPRAFTWIRYTTARGFLEATATGRVPTLEQAMSTAEGPSA